jgi:uncharacterized protein (TIGR03083 family)
LRECLQVILNEDHHESHRSGQPDLSSGCDDLHVEVAAGHVDELVQAAVGAHRRMWHPASRPAWMSVWARWRETEIHHVDLDTGYTHRQWPADFTRLLLPRVLPTLQARLADQVTIRAEATDHDLAATAAGTADDRVIVRGPASAILCWLLGRPAAAADLTVTRAGQPWTLPRLRPRA